MAKNKNAFVDDNDYITELNYRFNAEMELELMNIEFDEIYV